MFLIDSLSPGFRKKMSDLLLLHHLIVGGGGNPPKLELTGGGPGGDFLVNLGPKTLNNMGSSCEKEYGHRRFSISTSFPI